MTRQEAVATVSPGWRFLIERLYRQKPETCVILGVRRHGGGRQIRTSPHPLSTRHCSGRSSASRPAPARTAAVTGGVAASWKGNP